MAQVDDKVRLQEVDTWFDPLDMFRQIAPNGIVNKESMNRKVNMESALDVGPEYIPSQREASQPEPTQTGVPQQEAVSQPVAAVQAFHEPIIPQNDGVKISEEHNQPGKQPAAPEEAVPAHFSESTGERADAFVPHQGVDPDKPAANSNPTTDVPATQVVELAAGKGASVELEHPGSNFHVAQEQQQQQQLTQDVTTTSAAVNERAAEPTTANGASELPRSIYSSSVTGNVEDRVKTAAAGHVEDESKATGTYDAIDQHLESSARQVHPHSHDTEKAVQPTEGEAVAVPAQAEETRLTHEEMSQITPTECPFLMNRE